MMTKALARVLTFALASCLAVPAGAQTWQRLGPAVPAEATAAGVGPHSGGGTTLFAASGGSIGDFRSTDGGVTWTATGNQIFDSSNRVITANTFFRSSTGRVFRGGATASWENRVGSPLWYSDNDGVTWVEVSYSSFASASNSGAVSVTAMAESAGALFAAEELSDGVWKSTDDGITWSKVRNGLPGQAFVGNVINSGMAAHGGTVVVANPTYGLYRTTDGGANWTQSVGGIPGFDSVVGTIRVARDVVAATDGTFYAGVEKHLWKSTDAGQNWTLLSGGFDFGDIASVAVDGTKLYAYTTSSTLLESTDGGESFARVDGGTPAPYRGSNHRQLVVRNGIALYSGFDGTYRLDLNAAPRVPIAPRILTQPIGGGVNVGTSFTFSVATTRATAPVTYTWRRGTTVVATTSVPSYTIGSATLDDAGSWTVTVANAAGSVVSNAVDLVVAPFAPGQIDYSLVPLVIRDLSPYGAGPLSSINVNGIAAGRDGEVFAVGSWSAPSIALYRWTVGLARIGANGVLDTELTSNSGVLGGNVAYAVLPLDDGTMIVGGGAIGNAGASFFRKIDRTGAIDPAFVWPNTFNAGTYALLAGPPGSGTAYAAGAFGLRRFFTASGEEDTSFNPPDFIGNSSNTRFVRALATAPDGSLIIAGSFTSINGIAQNRIARIRADGSLDVTFAPPGVGSANGFNNTVNAVAVQADGKVVVGGDFTSFGGTTVTTLVRLNSDGTLDTGFAPGAVNGGVFALAIGLDGGIYVGGTFSTIGGAPANRLARLQAGNGALDTTFPGQVSNAGVNALTVQPDGRLLVGNTATAYRVLTPAVTTPRIARFSRDQALAAGTPVTLSVTLAGDVSGATYQWHKDGAPLAGRTAATLPIASFSAADEGTYHVVATVGATVLTSPNARLDLLGAPEFVRPPVAVIAHPEVPATLVAEARGVGPLSYQWTKDGVPVNGATATFLYFANPTAADSGDYRLTVTGPGGAAQSAPVRFSVLPRPMSRDANFTFAPGAVFSSTYSSWSALEQPDGSFLLGGHFTLNTASGGLPAGTYYLLHLNADGSVRTIFDNATYGLQAAVKWLVRQADGKILVGDARLPRRLLANLQPDSSFAPPSLGIFGENVTALAAQPDGKVIVGFLDVAGTYTRLARLNVDGSLDTSFPDLDPNGSVTALLREADGTLFVAGDFTTIGGVARNGFARITPAGVVDTTFVPPARTAMYGGLATPAQLARGPDGWLYLAGNFAKVGAIPANGLARFDASGNPDPRFYLTGRTGMQGWSVAFTGDRILLGSSRGSIPPGTAFVAESFRMNGALDAASGAFTAATSSAAGYGFLPLSGGRHLVLGSYTRPEGVSPMIAYTGTPGLAIGTQPQPAVVDLGGSVTLTAGAFGTSTIQYQWYRNGELLPGKTAASLVINPVTRGDEGTYTVVVTNASGTVTSRDAFVDVRAEPEIVTAPQAVTRPVGQTVTLTVSAVGAGTLSYRWTKGGTDLADGGAISGSGTATLTITNAQEADSGIYAVRVTNSLGSTTSATALVNVILQPGSLNTAWVPAAPNGAVQQVLVRADGRVLISAAASGGFTTVGGATNSRPAVALLNEDGTINTTFASTQSFGTSYTLRRFVLGPDGITPYVAISTGTLSFIYRYGTDGQATTLVSVSNGAIYDFVVESPERITYVGSFPARVARVNIQGTSAIADTTFTAPTFSSGSVFSIAQRAGGGYVLGGSFTSVNGSAYSHVIKLGADGALDTTFRPTNAYTVSGWTFLRELADGKVVFGGVRYGTTGALDPAWTALFTPNSWPATVTDMTMTLDGKLIVVGTFTSVSSQNRRGIVRLTDTGAVDADFASPTSLSGSLVGVGLGVNGRLYAGGSVTAYNGTNVNRVVRINHEPTDIAFVSQPRAIAANLDGSATISATAFGSSTLSYRWFKDGTALAEGGRFSGTTTASLTINPVQRGDAGDYRLEITNLAGTRLSNAAALTVLAEPVLVASPSGGNQPVGANVTLAATFSGATPLTWSWTRNGNPIANGGRFSGATTATLVITGITLDDTGTYVATATNGFGAAQTQPATITVIIPPASLDAAIPASLAINNTVTGLVPLPDGRFLVGGNFTSIGGQSRAYLAVLNASGAVDTSFTPPTMNGTVSRLFGLADGSILVSGSFTTVAADTTNYRYLYKLTSALALDTTFRPAVNSSVNAIVEETGGTLLLGGGFTSVGGNSTLSYLARVNASSGAVDTSLRARVNSTVFALVPDASGRVMVGGQFSASGTDAASGGPGYLARIAADGTLDTTWTLGANSTVYALARDPAGRILAGGDFTSFGGGTTARNRLARFLADGTVDPDFNPAPNNTIRSIAVQDNGSVLVSGSFTTIASTSANRLARLLPTGAIDPSWEIGTGLGSSATHYSDPIVIQPDGRIWLMGLFGTYKGTTVTYLVRLNGDPVDLAISRDLPALVVVQPGATFTLPSGATGTSAITYAWTRDGSLLADGGRVSGATTSTLQVTGAVVGDSGTYRMTATNASGARQTRPAQVIVLDVPVITRQPVGATVATATNTTLRVEALGAGTLTYQWRRNGENLANGGRVAGATTATLTLTGLTLADGGNYTVVVTNSLGSVTSATATLDVFAPPAGIDPGFNPAGAAGNTVTAVAIEPSGSVLIGGLFLGSQPRLARILPNGTRDAAYAPSPNSTVNQVTALADGKAIVMGGFSNIASTNRQYLVRLNANGTLDTAFSTPTFSPSGPLSHVVLPDGKILVAGGFSTVNGVARAGFARLNANGTLDTSFVPTGTSGTGRAILPLADGGYLLGMTAGSYLVKVGADGSKDNAFTLLPSSTVTLLARRGDGGVIVVGDFGAFNGVNRAFLAALRPDLSHDSTWGSTISLNNSISAVAVQPNGKVILGGSFTGNLRRLNADGTADTSFSAGAFGGAGSPPVQSIAVDTLGPIWVAGQFTSYAGTQANNLVRLNGDPVPLTILDQPDAIAVDVGGNATFGVTAAGTSALSYRWRKDGVNLADGGRVAGATTATLTLTGVTRDDAGIYDVIVSNASGELPSAEAVLAVRAEPVLVTQPASRVVNAGAPLSLAATFSGASPITYAWTFRGAPVPGATGATLDLGTADAAEAGLYVVTATNALGQASSEPVSVSVAVPATGSLVAWPATGHAPNGAVWRVELLADGKAYVAGAFTQVGSTSRVGIARYLADGTLDTAFTSPFQNNGTVIHDVRVLADGSLYAAGLFTTPTGASSGGVVRLTSAGAVDTTFRPPAYPFDGSTLYRVRVDSSGRVYVAGNVLAGGAWGYYGRMSSTGVLDATYLAFPYQYGYGADMHLVDDTGVAIVGGRLALGNGAFLNLYRLAPPNAAPDFTYAGALGANNEVWRILPQAGGGTLVGGNFTAFAGQSRGGLVKLAADGTVDSAFSGASTGAAGAFVRDLAAGPGGTTWVAGEFNAFNGSTVGYLTRVDATGAIDTSLYGGGSPTAFADGNVYALAATSDGGIIAGGAFANARGSARPFLARVSGSNPDAALRFVAEPADLTVEEGDRIVLRAAAVGGTGLTFQWLKGGNTLPGRTGPVLAIDTATEADEGEYSVVIASGGDTLTSEVATVTVGSTPPAPTFVSWIAGFTVPPGKAGALDDADDDGVRNLAAFAWGMAPVGGDRSRLPATTTVTIDGQRFVQFSYVRRVDAPSLAYQVRAATTLAGLSAPDLATEPVGDPVPLDATTERVTVRVTTALGATTRAFVDLRISVNPGP